VAKAETSRPLPYEAVRGELKTGDLLLFSGEALVSRMIRWRTRSAWSHVATIIRLENPDRVLIAESSIVGGVRLVRLSHYLTRVSERRIGYRGKVVVARHDGFGAADPAPFVLSVLDLLGMRYSYGRLGRIAYRSFFAGASRTRWGRRSRQASEFTCSEFVANCYAAVGLAPREGRGFSTPADFVEDPKVRIVAAVKT
jgi:hypothetical protein